MNETLEEEIKRIAYAVHDEAGQLLVAVHLALAEVALELPELQQAQFARIKEMLNQVENIYDGIPMNFGLRSWMISGGFRDPFSSGRNFETRRSADSHRCGRFRTAA